MPKLTLRTVTTQRVSFNIFQMFWHRHHQLFSCQLFYFHFHDIRYFVEMALPAAHKHNSFIRIL